MRAVLIVIAGLILLLSAGAFWLRPAGEAAMFTVSMCIAGLFGGLPVWAGHRTRQRAMREAGMVSQERPREIIVDRREEPPSP